MKKTENANPKKLARANSNRKFFIAILFVLSFVFYGNTLKNEYALDDNIVITQNRFVQNGFSGIADILTHDSFAGWAKDQNNLVEGGRYRPFSLITFAIEHQLFGTNAAVSHFINVLLLALIGIVIFLLLDQLFIQVKTNYSGLIYLPFLTALIFIAHPVHTEAVANIKGRDELLAMLFVLLSAYYFLRYFDEEKKITWLLISGACFFLGILSKENAITFAAVIPFMTGFFRKSTFREIIPVLIPIAASVTVYFFMRHAFAPSAVQKEITDLMNNPFVNMTSGQKYATILFTFAKYLLLLLLPVTLTNDYYPFQIAAHGFGEIIPFSMLIIIAVVSAVTVAQWTRRTLVAFCILYFALTFSVVSNLFFTVGTFMSERFLFMPSFAFCLLLAYFISLIPFYQFNTFPFSKKEISHSVLQHSFFRTKSIQFILLILIGGYAVRTITRNPVWKNNFTLFSEDINNSPNSAMAHHAIAGEYRKQGEKRRDATNRNKYFQLAIAEDKKAIVIYPQYTQAYYNIGITCLTQNDIENAESAFRKAIAISPESSDALNNLGYCFLQKGKLDSAIIMASAALKIDSTYFRPYVNIGASYMKQSDYSKAEYFYRKALTLDPGNTSLINSLQEINSIKQQ